MPFAKFELNDPDGDDNNTTVVTAGVNVFLKGHAAKLVLEYDVLLPEADGVDPTHIITTQFQGSL